MSESTNNEELDDQVTLTLDDGTELTCDIISIFPVKIAGEEKTYIALLPTNGSEEIYLYRFIQNGDSDEDIELLNIDDDDEFEAVSDAFDEMVDAEDFDEMFDDEEDEESEDSEK